ncbi:hypothetical protein PP101_52 [Pectobacterium phage PP101]|uniref:Uncharacterized protein n=1 Tax=Pectobacterium phage PP101 TaxID=1916414 RepID=A0A1J0MEU4_9CAUD|nr:hypothetical protein HOR42_gp52 [Pectobacterium phage PP101]APD19707.1 hypothetical protein PP101_52 [Pectobacterium phage PP101]
MRTIQCSECGHEIAEDDFISQHCPICDSYMPVSRLGKKADKSLEKILRINPVQPVAQELE